VADVFALRAGEVPCRSTVALLGLVTVLGAALRLHGLGSWSLSGDEGFTLAFSTYGFTWRDLRPLSFAMNRYITIPLFGPTELALRFWPAAFGIAAIPLLGYVTVRFLGRAAGIATAALIALSPVLVQQSQFGRYYMQSFLLAGLSVFGLRLWLGGLGNGWLIAAVAGSVAGFFIVPSTVFILPGLALWVLALRQELLTPPVLATVRRHRWFLLAAGLFLCLVAAALTWHIVAGFRTGALLTGVRYYTLPGLALSTVQGLSVPIAGIAGAGLVLMPAARDLPTADRWLLLCLTIGSALALGAAYQFMAVGASHVISVLAPAYVAGGWLLGRVFETARWRWPAAALAAAVVILSPARELGSNLVDGSRPDYRQAARWLRERARAGEPVLAMSHGVFSYYAPGLTVRELIADPDSLAWIAASNRSERVWLVVPEHRRGPDVDPETPAGRLVGEHCTARQRIMRQRFDYAVNGVLIYECPARPDPAAMNQSQSAP
jgi:predicted membrane-bound mannosyltransferase